MNTNHEIDKIRELQDKGYSASYQVVDDKLKNLKTGRRYSSDDVTIVEEYRYEGMSNPSDMSILYAIETSGGCKGTVLVPYGPTGDGALVSFMKNVDTVMKN